ncbi:ADAMTS-like protein 5 [Alligator mississippiensis]|uniref:ADAMTS-like protein 5 n=1 Tax=Alligator mississippiensis TaxID=8496 RepID=UPI002877DA1F|nr:ADAMTS-like protein 5 [Alligator mississippiensis]
MGPPRPGHGPPGRLLLLAWLSFNCACISSAQGATQEPRHRRQLGRGEWTPWGAWSACSSTCGDGVALRTRRCLRFPGEELCEGEPRRYRVCQLHACPSGSVPFRAMQCSLYNSKPILGKPARYQWVPFYGAPNLCDLNCLAAGHNFYYTFGRVLDGTRCSPDSPELCISGQCLRAGCDGILGSGAQRDACGQCGGRNESCVLVQRVFRAAFPSSGYFGYKNVTRIPAGATHIKVTDRSRNYLALMTAEQHYVINGDWAVDPPGVYEVAGTQVHYARTADERESLEAAGPTREDLYVTVLFQEPNPGIEYEFWLPRGHDGHFQADVSPLRQPQPREAHMDPPRQPLPVPRTTPVPTPPSTRATAMRRPPSRTKEVAQTGRCGRCPMPKGRSKRIHHYCHSDFVFQARILSQRLVGQETRYEVQVQHVYRSGSPLLRREYVWAPDTCGCPPLRPRHDYVLMAQRHVNYEHTLNRLLLPPGAYTRPWSPREDRHLRDAARHCPPARPA